MPVPVARYRLSKGRRYYRKGKLYKEGDEVLLPADVRIPMSLVNMDGSRPVWDDEVGAYTNVQYAFGDVASEVTTKAEVELTSSAAASLAAKHTKGELQEMAYERGLDCNGNKLDIAQRIVANDYEHPQGKAGSVEEVPGPTAD